MQATRTTRSATNVRNERTFRSGPYLESLFGRADAVDAYLQREICARIKSARKAAGLTQEDAAALLNVTTRAWQNYERARVPFRRMTDIARVTNRSEKWLLHGEPAATEGPDIHRLLESLETKLGATQELIARGFLALGVELVLPAEEQPPQAAEGL